MARIRTIKPSFFTSLTIADLTLAQRLTFVGLWTHVDDDGRCVADARLVKAAVWPLDERTAEDVQCDLNALTESSLIAHYEVDGRRYIEVCGWSEHQRINRRTASELPAALEGEIVPLTSGNEDSVRAHGGLSEGSRQEGNGKEGNGKEETTPSEPAAPAPDAVSHMPPGVSEDATRLTRLFAELAISNGHVPPKRGSRANGQWLIEMDRLLRLGPPGGTSGPPPGDVEAVIRWCAADQGDGRYPGESVNVAAVGKLRERWTQLLGKQRAAARPARQSSYDDGSNSHLDRFDPSAWLDEPHKAGGSR